mmetsp:Transcript_24126/g.71812  ORF Transcript_24126/g.71812 Transcript_24126/m.71812 type:complete len:205 (+) Transcript_24126:294-908(+)
MGCRAWDLAEVSARGRGGIGASWPTTLPSPSTSSSSRQARPRPSFARSGSVWCHCNSTPSSLCLSSTAFRSSLSRRYFHTTSVLTSMMSAISATGTLRRSSWSTTVIKGLSSSSGAGGALARWPAQLSAGAESSSVPIRQRQRRPFPSGGKPVPLWSPTRTTQGSPAARDAAGDCPRAGAGARLSHSRPSSTSVRAAAWRGSSM